MARSTTGRDAPDPSLGGPIRNIVRTAHKWGGNGTIPLFDKIKRVLLSKHPEVVAKAFGGDANKAAAWIKDNWMAMHGHDPTHWRGKGKTTAQQLATTLGEDQDSEFFTVELADDDFTMEDLFQEVPLSMFDGGGEELFLASPDAELEERDGMLWWPVCRTGTWMRSPLPGGKPLKLTKQHFDEAVDAFNAKAWEYVTIPLTHEDRVEENTGYIQGLEIREDPTRPGEHRLWGGHKFTEPEIEEKVRRKSIIGRSVLLNIGGHRDTESGKFWPTVLKHVALTNKPWLNGLNDGVIAASQDGTAPTYESVEDDADEDSRLIALAKRIGDAFRSGDRVMVTSDGDVVALESDDDEAKKRHRFVGRYGGKCTTCGKVYRQGNHHGYTLTASEDSGDPPGRPTGAGAPIVIISKGGASMGEKKDGDGTDELRLTKEEFQEMVSTAAQAAVEAERTKWEGRQSDLEARLSQSETEAHRLRVDRRIASFQEKGVPPAVCTQVRELMLAQRSEGGELRLSQTDDEGNTTEVSLSIEDAMSRILESIPDTLLEKRQTDLSLAHSGGGTPPADGDDPTKAAKEKADAMWDDMHNGPVAHVG